MYTIKSKAQFIDDIRSLDPTLTKIRLSSVEIDKKTASIKYVFICDQTVSELLRDKIALEVEKITPKEFKEHIVIVKKIVTNAELINNEIYKFLSQNYPSISIFLKPTDVISDTSEELVKYTLRLTKDGVEYVKINGAIPKLSAHLERNFCSDFVGKTEEKENEETVSLLDEVVFEGQLQRIEHRTVRVNEVVVIDDLGIGDRATYIEDITDGDVVVSGIVTEISERTTKTGKPFFIIHIDDTTGRTSGVYFTKKASYPHIKCIKVGDGIIARAKYGDYNGKKSLTFSAINRCSFPSDFVKKEKFKKSAPLNYSLIFPQPAESVSISSVFDNLDYTPEELIGQTFVVFDLETTGLEVSSNGITEIGAVKIVDGKITEHFTSLIKPDYPILPDNIAITGITPEMVKDAPKISSVIPDFMKFIDGATLVAHNADFDMKFLRRFADAEEYSVKNKVLDTMIISRNKLPSLRKHDLHTIAEYFGIVFRHHRALSDAYATAEAFIKLAKIKR